MFDINDILSTASTAYFTKIKSDDTKQKKKSYVSIRPYTYFFVILIVKIQGRQSQPRAGSYG